MADIPVPNEGESEMAKQLSVPEIEHSVISGALYDFLGYITARPVSIYVGSRHTPGPLLDALKEKVMRKYQKKAK